MSLQPLLAAPPVIIAHALAAMAAFALGAIQLLAPKGTKPHRVLGWVWTLLLAAVALSSFWIHTIRQWGDFSWIHLLSIFTLIMLPRAVLAARRGNIARHRRGMILLYTGALVIAGGFTFYPGRIMNHVLFGTPPRAATSGPR